MTKAEIAEGLAKGRTLIQEEWSTREEIQAVDDLVADGVAVSTPWQWHDNFQCERRKIRRAEPKIGEQTDG